LEDYSRHVRRKDRQQSDRTFLNELLHNSVSCSIAIQRDGYPLNHIAFFAFNEPQNEIIFHYSKHGFAGSEITTGKAASISVYKYGKLYTANRAVDFGCEYQSIIIYGRIHVLTEEADRMNAMRIFFQKYFSHIPEGTYQDFTTQDAKPIDVAKIKIDEWFGKEHRVPDLALSSFYSPIDSVMK
jgi:nitroimidazol reductase NimA-like FMN-containing flavoprotein (pyridoxamine 5'-phosphate oxidase superfamily)